MKNGTNNNIFLNFGTHRSMGGTRNNEPIWPISELNRAIVKRHLPAKFHRPSSKITQVIVRTDGQTDGQTDGHRSNAFFFDSMKLCQRHP